MQRFRFWELQMTMTFDLFETLTYTDKRLLLEFMTMTMAIV